MNGGVNESISRSVRTLFLSDIHLGTRGCQAEALLDFLKVYDAEEIYLIGDIVDGWRLRQSWHWPQKHNDVVQKLLRKVRKGTRVVYIPGNHDEFLRDYSGLTFGGVEIQEEAVHICANGQKILLLHGDKFDTVVRNVRWLALLGDHAYDFAIWLNNHISRFRRVMGLPYWSFSQWSKDKVKSAVSFVTAFEEAVVHDARKQGADIVICGHIHKAIIRHFDDITYINTGDWVESCTAVVEHFDGRLEICHWHDKRTELTDHATEASKEALAA